MCILIGERLAVFWTFSFYLNVFWVENAKIDFGENITVILYFFYSLLYVIVCPF